MMIVIRLLPVFFAVCCFLAAILLRREKRGGIRHPVPAQAVVISSVRQMEVHHNAPVERIAPVVRYMTDCGEITAASQKFLPEWQYTYRTGEQIPICYEKEQPSNFRICCTQGDVWISNFLLVIGAGTLLAYAVLYLQYYKL